MTAFLALNTNAPSGPTPPGMPPTSQLWDFSQSQQPYELVWRTDIVSPTNGGDSQYFPGATYAEQVTSESNILGWQYYSFTNSGRVDYGLDEPVVGASAEAVFTPPCIDIPSTVQLNQTWDYQINWMTLYYQFLLVSNYMSNSVIVDAYGTLVLPQIGSVPALRVHETHSYAISVVSDPPILYDLHTNEYYYWLVPNLGVAAQVYLMGNNALNPVPLPYTNAVFRMYSASYFTNVMYGDPPLPPMPINLSIQNTGPSIILNWQSFTNCSSYRIDFVNGLPPQNWQPLGYTTGNCWTDSISSAQGFYRVVGSP